MDTDICGLSRITCNDIDSSYEGKQVTITNGQNTWTATVTDGSCAFLIPSIPTPARRVYSLSVENGDNSFETDFRLSFGEDKVIILKDGYEPVTENRLQGLNAKTGKVEKFQFGIDAAGRYGYIKDGADTVTPFRTGAETFCYKLPTSNSINIANVCKTIKDNYGIDIDYRTLGNGNFIAHNSSGVAQQNQDSKSISGSASSVYVKITQMYAYSCSWSYNNSTGVLTVNNGSGGADAEAGAGGSYPKTVARCACNVDAVYLIKQMN